MSFKIPCGGFKLDEKSFSLDENGVLSIPKPLTYDYMPEGYPKKDGRSVEWDGNIEGLTYIPIKKGVGIYKISGMVLTDDDLLSATCELLDYPGKTFNIPADGLIQLSDSVTIVESNIRFITVRKDNADINGLIIPEKGVYVFSDSERFKMTKETITPMSTDFIPKNLNVVFSRGSTSSIPTYSCNVTYDELRGWIENGTPVFAICKIEDNNGSVVNVINIMQFLPNTDSLSVYYQTKGSTDYFKYNSDGTISRSGVES